LSKQPLDCEEVSEALVAYGKEMYNAGKSYGRFSETINAVTAKRSALRRSLQSAWDLAFNWVADEPHEHHAALPLSLMIGCITLAMLWGWLAEAAVIALTWTGVLRVGESLAALREDLVLPCDAAPGTLTALLKIRQPKTRGRAARHQAAKIDPEDIVNLLIVAFQGLMPGERLWPFSPSRLRRRFAALLATLGLPAGGNQKATFSLSSLRPGGATFWLGMTEDAEYVRRKGRWLSTQVLEIYLQEAAVMTYHTRMSNETRSRVESLCSAYPNVLNKVQFFKKMKIPEEAWPRLW
jgi:hypothetical protein